MTTLDAVRYIVGALLLGLLIGASMVFLLWERIFRLTHLPATVKSGTEAPASRSPVNAEASAQRRVTLESIDRGADELIRRSRDNGVILSLKDAKAQAAQMLMASDPLGGVR